MHFKVLCHSEKNPFPHYYPSFNGGPSPDARYEHPPLATGNQAYYYDYAYEGMPFSSTLTQFVTIAITLSRFPY